MRWVAATAGGAMTVAGVAAVVLGADGLVSGERVPLTTAVLGGILAMLGVGLVRDARRPRNRRREEPGESGYSTQPPAGDGGADGGSDGGGSDGGSGGGS